jgi:hypothetical protein
MRTDCGQDSFEFGTAEGHRVVGAFDGSQITSHAVACVGTYSHLTKLKTHSTPRRIRVISRHRSCSRRADGFQQRWWKPRNELSTSDRIAVPGWFDTGLRDRPRRALQNLAMNVPAMFQVPAVGCRRPNPDVAKLTAQSIASPPRGWRTDRE